LNGHLRQFNYLKDEISFNRIAPRNKEERERERERGQNWMTKKKIMPKDKGN